MLGLVTRVVEAQISLSLDVMRKSAEFAGRIAGWALNEAARQLAPERPTAPPPPEKKRPASTARPSETRSGKAARKADNGRESTPTKPSDTHATAPDGPSEAHVTAPAAEVDDSADLRPSEPADVSGGEDGDTVEHEPGVGTSVRARTPHSALNNPVTEPDMTEWPDPYDKREDPRDPGQEMVFGADADHVPPGAISTSEPHPSQDPEAEPWEGPKRDKVDQ